MKSVEEAADHCVQQQQEKILTAEKALITQDLKGKLRRLQPRKKGGDYN